MAQNGTEPPDSGITLDYERSISGSLGSVNPLTDGQASASSSTQSHQRSRLQDSEYELSIDELLAALPSGGVEAKVKELEDENALLKDGMLELRARVRALERSDAENIGLKAKVSDLEGQVSNLNSQLGHVTDLLRQKALVQNTKDKEQERTNRASVGGANIQSDLFDKFVEGWTEKMRQLESQMQTAQHTAENAIKAVNERHLPGGLQQPQ